MKEKYFFTSESVTEGHPDKTLIVNSIKYLECVTK